MLLSFYPVDYAFLILLGLGSSLHCAGMCVPIACSYALPLVYQKPSLLWSYHLRYTLGRLLVYGWLGADGGDRHRVRADAFENRIPA